MDETVLITGSSKGLGKELALVFAERGYDIILHGRNEADLERVKKEVSKFSVKSYIVKGDLKDNETIDALYRKAEEKGISVLINNGAVTCPGLSLEDLTNEQVVEMVIVNMIAPINISRKIYPLFLEKGYGNIININSLAGLEPKKPRTIYCATKYGLRGFSDALRLEVEEKDIQIMSVYLSKMKNNLEDLFGMDLKLVSDLIYDSFKTRNIDELIIDARPEKFKETRNLNKLIINGKKYEI